MKVLSIFGTRPEAIKMAPLVRTLEQAASVDSVVCITGQHRTMLEQVMNLFDIKAHHDLDVMVPNQSLNSLCSRIFAKLDPILESERPDRVLVHGDTSTAMVAATAAFHRRIPVGHVEAGLRTGDLSQPWPEEMNRRVVDVMSDFLFAPTVSSRDNLLRENLAGRIVVTGNTVIDALQLTAQRLDKDASLRARLDTKFPFISPQRRVLLVTGHRRENFGDGFAHICEALAELAQRPDIDIVYPVHLNPNVRGPVQQLLSNLPRVHLIEPLDYLEFVRLMQLSHVVLTDSGGVQEEAPSLGKPVLVMRDVTERPEAVAAGTVQLIGTSKKRIVDGVSLLFDDEKKYQQFSNVVNPYGDGHASSRIVRALLGKDFEEFNAATDASLSEFISRGNYART
ncbi:MAG: UDP-N-acetylglucosamine 2-epimerase (non-hydrolyzing) [Burkholderiaceae bacterium]|uniref:UDP-N-acetylglucosamine 2-epimerase (non-hydrolyzing) n=1 Tax=Herminiimonas contaminans TaxID=1111140 RepID=A0ABS0EW26_9BURK|nr:UDP-N-acetylglucosamine 2-epimerase (non-hydrolyzing) [Herminiimonas contaminans]MBF8179049.1 UDP-N-acetylglucosamine 2-epimerase (non-hydrolyzing) [Herminiimonas contaminans]MBX9798544.1 UDP-N-acetylglucosamine 2-epimerase (non-hydrolyzing) [Burkholderiaceae bacterium]